ncbi:hypothetical protein WBP07_04295 [Novosphingobium sp. BL-8A]|uniref:hypothetical protein n=1 Tax=Novosphingobium sp. BL-8A TaxID=3127639 RepID=UPI003757D3F9
MRIPLFLLASFPSLALAGVAEAAPQPLGTIWQNGRDAVVVTPCPPGGDTDAYCRAVEVRQGEKVTPLGTGYMVVTPLWIASSPASTPTLVVLGDNGGSGSLGDLFVISLTPELAIRRLRDERMDSVAVRSDGASPAFELPFDIEFFNGAPHAGAVIVKLPVRWKAGPQGGDFALDFRAMVGPPPSAEQLETQAAAMRQELAEWARDKHAVTRLYPPEASAGTPVTVQTLADLVLSGHADLARDLLHRAWPRNAGHRLEGENAFWTALCTVIARHPLWKRLALDQLPHPELIIVVARAQIPSQ